MPKEASSCRWKPFECSDGAFRERKSETEEEKSLGHSGPLPTCSLTFALYVWEGVSFLFPLTSLPRIHTTITCARLHDITASSNAQGRIVLKLPHKCRRAAVSREPPAAPLVSMGDTQWIHRLQRAKKAGKYTAAWFLIEASECVCPYIIITYIGEVTDHTHTQFTQQN